MAMGKTIEELAKPPQSPGNTTISVDWLRCHECGEEYFKLIDGHCFDCNERLKALEFSNCVEERRISKSIGKKGFDLFTFDKFKPDEGSQKAFDACRSFDPAKSSLYLWGPAGCGKTHLSGAIFRSHPGAAFYKSTEIVRWFRMRDPREEELEIMRLASVPVLVVDDLGVQKDSEHALTVLYEIFDRRDMDLRHGLIITSNLSMKDMAAKMGDDRIPSRIAGMCDVIELKGKDRRISK